MKTIINTGIALLVSACSFAQGLLIEQGATFKTTGGVSIVVQDANLVNNGNGDLQSANLYLTGSLQKPFGGGMPLSVKNFYLNRPGFETRLANHLSVEEQLVLTNGMINLNGKNINFSPAGLLIGETETNRITGVTGGEISITVNLNSPLAVNPGNLGAIITSGASLGSVVIKRGHKFATNAGGSRSINRYYDIKPQNNSGLNAYLRFTYLDAELATVNETELNMYKSTNNGITWTNSGISGRNTSNNFLDLSGIGSFTRLTLAKGPVVLAPSTPTAPTVKSPAYKIGSISPKYDVSVYPNPVQDIMKAKITTTAPASGHILVMNLAGQLLQAKPVQLAAGTNTFEFDLSILARGAYKIVFDLKGSEKKVEQIIKQ